MRYQMRPLLNWPRPDTRNRKRDPYSVSWDRTISELAAEAEKLGVDDGLFVLQVDVDESAISINNAIKGGRDPRTPRVALSLSTKKYGPLIYRCDRFFDWRGNFRAIALGMQRLRLVDETGIVTRGEQYTGFKALPAGIELGPAAMSIDEAARAVENFATGGSTSSGNLVLSGSATFKDLYRAAAKRLHPDAGGDRGTWDRLQEAAAVLEKHFAGGM